MDLLTLIKKVGVATPTFGNKVLSTARSYILPSEQEARKNRLDATAKEFNSFLLPCYRYNK